MMELFAQTHSICLICQAQRGFLLFLTVNLGQGLTVAKLRRFKKISLKAPVGFAIVAAHFLYEEALTWL